MKLKHLLAVVLLLSGVSCRRGDSPAAETQLGPKETSPALAQRLAALDANADADGIRMLTERRRFRIDPHRVGNYTRAAIGDDNSLYVLDVPNRAIVRFDSTGQYLGRVPSDPEAARIGFAVDIAATGGKLTVLEFEPRRITQYGSDGRLSQTTFYGPARISLHGVAPRTDGSFDVIGESPLAKNAMLHHMSANGERLSSQLDASDLMGPVPSGTAYMEPRFARYNGALYFMSVTNYRVFKLDDKGLTVLSGISNSDMTPPLTAIPDFTDRDASIVGFADWCAQWTPISAFLIVDNTILIQRQVLKGTRYKVDLWDISSQSRRHSFDTNYLAIAARGDEVLWTLPRDNRGADGTVIATSLSNIASADE